VRCKVTADYIVNLHRHAFAYIEWETQICNTLIRKYWVAVVLCWWCYVGGAMLVLQKNRFVVTVCGDRLL